MATRKHPNPPDARLPGEAEIARTYHAGAQDEPPAALDRKILAAAQQALDTSRPRAAFGSRWAIPLSVAAVLLLSVGVLLQMQEPGLLQPVDSGPAPGPMETASAPMARALPQPSPAKRLSKALPAAPPAAAPLTDGAAARSSSDAYETGAKSDVAPGETTMARGNVSVARERRTDQAQLSAQEAKTAAGRNAKQGAASLQTHADVTAVSASGQAGAYAFSVSLSSPDSGCRRYADWWEVVSDDGKLLYRRVLLHSHVDEQPFTRGGGPVPIQPTTRVWVRAHMNTVGYGGAAFHGSVQTGFAPATPPAGFAAQLATQAPLPSGCEF
jgi:hypothetical protein